MVILAISKLAVCGIQLRCEFADGPLNPLCHINHGNSWDMLYASTVAKELTEMKLNFDPSSKDGYDKGFIEINIKEDQLIVSSQLFPSDTNGIHPGFLQFDLLGLDGQCSYCRHKRCVFRSDEVFKLMNPVRSTKGRYLIILCNVNPEKEVAEQRNEAWNNKLINIAITRVREGKIDFSTAVRGLDTPRTDKVDTFPGNDDLYLPVIHHTDNQGTKRVFLIKGPYSNLKFDAALCTSHLLMNYLPMNRIRNYYVPSFQELFYKPKASKGTGKPLTIMKHYNGVGCFQEDKEGNQAALDFVPADDKRFDGFYGLKAEELWTYNELNIKHPSEYKISRRVILV